MDPEIKAGVKVHYVPFEGCDVSQIENGMIKSIPEHRDDAVFVVFHCNDEWDNIQNYTAAMTPLNKLAEGWI